MSVPRVTVVDFETEPIEPRPAYPPRPVGVALKPHGRPAEYLAWGHPVENTTTFDAARRRLADVWRSGPLLFHGAEFDLDVAEVHFGLAPPPYHEVHCTQLLAFLDDPNRLRVGLKDLADEVLGIAPTERDDLRAWILDNVPEAKRAKANWGAFIHRAPGRLVGRYAKGDTTRPAKLFPKLYRAIVARKMTDAYDRKRRMMFLLLELGRRGVPVDVPKLAGDIAWMERTVDATDEWLRKYLREPALEVDKAEQLADALERHELDRRGEVDWILTGKARKRSTKVENLRVVVESDPRLVNVLDYRAKIANSLRTFARPWFAMAESTGHIYTIWNQTRQERGRRRLGARTGRLSSTPNFQNIPKKPRPVTASKAEFTRLKKAEQEPIFVHAAFVKHVERATGRPVEMPNVRAYVVADPRHRVAVRDYSQQELRILAHFEDGELVVAYRADPWRDFHDTAKEMINRRLGTSYPRKPIKNTGFAILYGEGLDALAEQIGSNRSEASRIRKAYKAMFPGIPELEAEMKRRAAAGEPIRTWGGREYHVEPPMYSEKFGRVMEFDYKLLNTLIQGSAADTTEQAMLNYDELDRDGRLLLQVHDELVASLPKRGFDAEMTKLREAMEAVEFDVPMLSEGKAGPAWGTAVDYDKKGRRVR